jgi:two-component system, NtrC family, sensor kinase
MKPNPSKIQPSGSTLSLRTKFNVGIAGFLLIVCFISALLIYRHEKNLLKEIAYTKTEMVMASVEAARAYVREELRPRMFAEFGSDFFMLEAMSTSYVGRAVMDRFGKDLPDFQYRRVSINARNPLSEADALETRMIEYFKAHPDQYNWQGLAGAQADSHFMRFQPVFFDDSCMQCHGDPRDAPKELTRLYGEAKGFGHFPGELAGIIAVGVPVHSALSEIKERAASVFITVFLGLSVFYLFLTFFFDRIVVANLRGVLNLFRETLDDADLSHLSDGEPPKDELHKDELLALTVAASTMAGQLQKSRRALESHNLELERKVAQRTQALQESQRRLQDKVLTRNQELRTLNRISELTTQAQGVSDIWSKALGESLLTIPAQGAGLYLMEEDAGSLVLKYQEKTPGLPQSVILDRKGQDTSSPSAATPLAVAIRQAFKGEITRCASEQQSHWLNVPISCRGKILGVMSFLSDADIEPEQQALLLSIGRQIGVALEGLGDRQRLVQSKELLQSVFDGITDMVVLLDADFRIKMVNKAYLKRYHVELADVYNTPCYEAHSGNLEACAGCALNTAAVSRKAVSEEIRYAGGELFLVHFYPVLDEEGRLVSIIRYSREITDQKKVERKIQQAEKLVAMGQLAAGVAHEINNPLGVILCYVDLLKRELAERPQGLQDLAVIEKQTLNSKRIVTDLLQFARSHESAKQAAELNSMVHEVVQFLAHQFKQRKVDVLLRLGEQIPPIHMDVNKMKQVLINLLMNASQAIEGRGEIIVSTSCRTAENQVEISVRDNGQGIDPVLKNKIFDPFFTTKATGQSTGLGLSVSYGIIEDHNGEITVESEPGQWTCFTIRLPVGG